MDANENNNKKDEKEMKKRKDNIDIALNRTKIALLMWVIQFVSELVAFIFGDITYGFIFSIISIFFLGMSRRAMSDYKLGEAKILTILALLSIWTCLIICATMQALWIRTVEELLTRSLIPYNVFSLLYIAALIDVIKYLLKAGNPKKYKENTDWFYEDDEDDETSESKNI